LRPGVEVETALAAGAHDIVDWNARTQAVPPGSRANPGPCSGQGRAASVDLGAEAAGVFLSAASRVDDVPASAAPNMQTV